MNRQQGRNRARRAGFGGLVSAALVAVLTACSAGGPAAETGGAAAEDGVYADLYAAALEEGGQVTWYSSFIPENLEVIEKQFEEQFPGVDLQVLRLGGTEGPIRFSSEMEAGAQSADVLTTSETDFGTTAAENGWTEDISAFDLPTYADFPEEFVNGPLFVTQIAPIRVTYNTELVETPPETWEDLLEPEYQGQMMLVDPSAILPWMAQYNLLYEEYGVEYLEGLAGQDFRPVDSAVPAAQSLAAGEGFVVFPSLDSVANPMIEEGAPVANATLTPFTGVENSTMISSAAPNPETAKLFAAWLMGPEGQTAVNSGFAASPLPDVPNVASVGDGYVPYDPAVVEANRDTILTALGFQ
ncbi:ABC transporter substrate-binding protein [Gulosibacter chungangensis]|nr:extracellular solute-binding protein [Gulosibacter chungangensis]